MWKKLLERFSREKANTRMLIGFGAAAVVLVAAMLLPLAFRTSPAPEELPGALTLEERTLLFADYWLRGASEGDFTVGRPDPVPRRMQETCETVMRTLIARCVGDEGLTDLSPTGTEYTVVTDGDGREVRLCRMWLEKRGDWQNWLDVCMDAETGELYYFYLSRECLTNRQKYPMPEKHDAAAVAEILAAERGWTLRHLTDVDGETTAVYSTPGGTVCFKISCRVYDALVDVKLTCC